MFKPRPHQQEVLRYTGGWMGVSAVPGSGKTQTLSMLAANLITDGKIEDDQEVLIVTLVNSAVDNFTKRIETELKKKSPITGFGYRVRTLHALCHDIVRERPDLAGLSNDFVIADERDSNEILANAALAWTRRRPDVLESLILPNLDSYQTNKALREWTDLVVGLARSFIRMAKDLQVTAEDLRTRLQALNAYYPLLEMGIDIYSDYQRALNYRSALDFDDLISYALRALRSDAEYLSRLQRRWPYILEDEAQDSSRLQQEILTLLSGQDGNWVRVGDPNQAIYETFTTASPEHLKDFIKNSQVVSRKLPQSGRSTQSIMDLANEMIRWTMYDHPNEELRNALTTPLIEPTPRNDPQVNPADRPGSVFLSTRQFTPADEIQAVVKSVRLWLPQNKDATMAVLDPRNRRGSEIADELRKANVETFELLSTSSTTRKTVNLVTTILHSLSDPTSIAKLTDTFRSLYELDEKLADSGRDMQTVAGILRKCQRVEEYLWPAPGSNWLERLSAEGVNQITLNWFEEFRNTINTWQNATLLPIDQLVLTISQSIFSAPADLALAHKLALALEQSAGSHPDWHMPEFTNELDSIVRSERKFSGFGDEDQGFDPEQHRGKAVVTTLHKAKGLEWDRVYILSANNYDFPAGDKTDRYMSEKWFIKGKLNLEAEALAQLMALAKDDRTGLNMEVGIATHQARLDYARERLRLMFVGITRAKKELYISWNSGKANNCHAAIALSHLDDYWKERMHEHKP
jgi:DNA helicase-2/ATP-dependent DNA helicase PcrA